jgi:hypothetical protein
MLNYIPEIQFSQRLNNPSVFTQTDTFWLFIQARKAGKEKVRIPVLCIHIDEGALRDVLSQ